jgi:hypothetical protein
MSGLLKGSLFLGQPTELVGLPQQLDDISKTISSSSGTGSQRLQVQLGNSLSLPTSRAMQLLLPYDFVFQVCIFFSQIAVGRHMELESE